jgi:hypothetical protein
MARHTAVVLAVSIAAISSQTAVAGNLYVGSAFNTADTDGDGIFDIVDNAPYHVNADQADTDTDGLGDAADAVDNNLDPDGDGLIDSIDAQTQNMNVGALTYTLGGPYFVSIGQNLAVTYSADATSDSGFDRLTVSVDGVPNVAKYILTPSAPAITLFASDLAALGINTVGPHTFGVKSYYDQLPTYPEAFTTINVVVPEPTTLAGALLASMAGRRRR